MVAIGDFEAVERMLQDAEISIDRFCVEVPMARSTWQRWKAEQTSPSLRQWQKVQRVLQALIAQAQPQPAGISQDQG